MHPRPLSLRGVPLRSAASVSVPTRYTPSSASVALSASVFPEPAAPMSTSQVGSKLSTRFAASTPQVTSTGAGSGR